MLVVCVTYDASIQAVLETWEGIQVATMSKWEGFWGKLKGLSKAMGKALRLVFADAGHAQEPLWVQLLALQACIAEPAVGGA